jgi:hypothetical protein
MEELFHGRFVEEQFTPAMLTAHRWQVFTPMFFFLSSSSSSSSSLISPYMLSKSSSCL